MGYYHILKVSPPSVEILPGYVSPAMVTILTNKEPVVRGSDCSRTTHFIHSFRVRGLRTATICSFTARCPKKLNKFEKAYIYAR
jgi:glycerol-3-phosphate responsive antiterminator